MNTSSHLTDAPTGWHGLIFDLHLAATFLLRLPLPELPHVQPGALTRAMRIFPLVGAGVGAMGGLVYTGAVTMNLTPLLAALLAIAAMTWLTGGLHEDGLADMTDGFGATGPRARKLAVMRDSCLGTFGVLALVFGVAIRAAAIAAVGANSVVAAATALVLAEAMGRAAIPFAMRLAPPARSDGLGAVAISAADNGDVLAAAVIALAIAIILALILRPPRLALAAALAMGGAVGLVMVAARRHIGGQTGDILGAAGYIASTVVLISLAASP